VIHHRKWRRSNVTHPLIIGVIALILSGCAAVGYGVGGAGAARSEVIFLELEKRVQAIEDRICPE